MSDCSNLQSQLNSIAAKLDRVLNDRSNLNTEIDKLKGEIIRLKQLVSSADNKASNALSALNPLETKAAQAFDLALDNQGEIGTLGAQIAALGASVAAAVALARAAMAWIGGIGAAVAAAVPLLPAIAAGLAAVGTLAATIAAIQARLDAIERLADSALGAAGQALDRATSALNLSDLAKRSADFGVSIGSEARRVADSAIGIASQALRQAGNAESAASTANRKADDALGAASAASAKADSAASAASTANRKADDALGAASAASAKADSAASAASTANRKADDALGAASAASAKADSAASAASTANRKADDALGAASAASAKADRAAAIPTAPIKAEINNLKTQIASIQSGATAPVKAAVSSLKTQIASIQSGTTAAIRAVTQATTPTAISQIVKSEVNQMNDVQTRAIMASIEALPTSLSNNATYRSAMATAAAAGVCQSTKPGGCLGNQFDGLKITMNDFNALLQGLQLRLLIPMSNTVNVINNKLGAQVVGGLSKWVTNIADIVNRSQILNVLTWIATLHNAYFLSSSLTQTLFSAISNSLAALGLKDTSKVAEGVPWDINKIVGDWVEGFFKTIFGVQTVEGIKSDWKKYSRIYQAAANIIYSFQSIGHSILGALEVVGSWTAKIGNALQKWRIVGERAYSWMNPNVDFQNRFFTTLQQTQEVVSQIDQVASEVLSVQETITQLGKNKDELFKSVGEATDGKKSDTKPEAAQVKESEDAAKSASASPAISESDQVRP